MKKIVTILLALSMALSLVTVAYAEEAEAPVGDVYDAVADEAYEEAEEAYVDDDDLAPVGEEEDLAETGDPLYPEISAITTARGGFFIRWNPFGGAVRYRLFVKFNGSSWQVVADTDATSAYHIGLTDNTAYTYTVRAIGEDGYYSTDCNRAGWTETYHDAPVLRSVAPNGNTLVFSWNGNNGVALYRVYRKENNSGWVSLCNTEETRYVDENVVSGVRYTYTVRCMTEDGSRFASYFDPAGVGTTFASVPMITKFDNLDGSTRFYWSGTNGAVKYRAFVKASNGWARVGDTANTWIDHRNLASGAENTYTVRALDANGRYISDFYRQGWSNRYLAHPQLVSVESAYNGLKFTWKSSGGANKFRVYKKNGGSWRAVGNTENSYYIDETAAPGETATYTVRCLSDDEKQFTSYFDRTGKTGTFVKAPEIVSFQNNATGTRISIKSTPGAVKYRFFYKGDNGWIRVGDTAGTTIDHNDLTDGKTYIYTVRALGANGAYISAHNPAGWSNTFIAPPKMISVDSFEIGNLIACEEKVGAAGYRFYRRSYGGSWVTLTNTDRNSFLDQTVPDDVPYTYTARTLDADGNLSSYCITSTPYYYDGELANGTIGSYYFTDGYIRKGFVTIDEKLYYYNDKGILGKNGIVGSPREGYYYADENGVCAVSEDMRLAAEFVARECKGNTPEEKMKYGFLYMARTFPYRRCYDHPAKASDVTGLAVDMFKNRSGNCYRYAAAFACVARVCGYDVRVDMGKINTASQMVHGWTEVYYNGRWRYCDVDAQLENYAYQEYATYMMTTHVWPVVAFNRCELTLDEYGNSVWIDLGP